MLAKTLPGETDEYLDANGKKMPVTEGDILN